MLIRQTAGVNLIAALGWSTDGFRHGTFFYTMQSAQRIVSKKRGPQYTIILIMGTPEKVPVISRNSKKEVSFPEDLDHDARFCWGMMEFLRIQIAQWM